jgi:hypothetical protein
MLQTHAFNRISRSLEECGCSVSDMQIRIWECAVKEMRKTGLSHYEDNHSDEPYDVMVKFGGVQW